MAIHSIDNQTQGVQDQMQQIREGLGTTSISPVIEGQEQGYVTTKNAQILANDGTYNRVVIGQRDDGSYGIKVSKSGYDALTAGDTNLVMNSDFNNLKVYATGTVTLTTSRRSPRAANTAITHNLGYSPLIIGSVLLSSGLSNEIIGFPGIYSVHDGSVYRTRALFEYYAADLNTAMLQVREDIGTGDWTFRYYILVETSR